MFSDYIMLPVWAIFCQICSISEQMSAISHPSGNKEEHWGDELSNVGGEGLVQRRGDRDDL